MMDQLRFEVDSGEHKDPQRLEEHLFWNEVATVLHRPSMACKALAQASFAISLSDVDYLPLI